MFFIRCICWFVCLKIIIYAIQIQSSDDQNVHPKRIKRLINFQNIEEISIEQHNSTYPFIVGIKTVKQKVTKKIRVRCSGTLLNAHLVLTTSSCVSEATLITVFPFDNPLEKDMNIKGVKVRLRSVEDYNRPDTDKRRFPNPLFYGLIIDRTYKFTTFRAARESYDVFKLRNVAMLYLDHPLHPKTMKIYYPELSMNLAKFMFNKSEEVEVFGWCQYEVNTTIIKKEPRLTKTKIKVTYCEEKNEYVIMKGSVISDK